MKDYFFVGIGGSGMSALAQLIKRRGAQVAGSDRNYDRAVDRGLYTQLKGQGIMLYPQDGSGITEIVDEVIASGAVERDNPDLMKARQLSVPVTSRSEFLARIFNSARGIAVAGSSGKSTITAMAARVMEGGRLDPTVINGAVMPEYRREGSVGNVKVGSSELLLVETDESDGSIVSYYPEVGILANISKDHKPLAELMKIFGRFLANVKDTIIINADCPFVSELSYGFSRRNLLSFGLKGDGDVCARDVSLSESAVAFMVNKTRFRLPVPGIHNVSNALAVIALGTVLQIPFEAMREALETFQGVARRLEVVGSVGNIRVIDDFSHNPAKIAAALAAVRERGGRVVLIYQPHGYGPTRFMKEELVETFNKCLTSEDFLILLDIYYAGGTVDASISTADLLEGVHVPRAEKAASREGVTRQVTDFVNPGDDVVVMGARDPTLSDLARAIVIALSEKLAQQTQ